MKDHDRATPDKQGEPLNPTPSGRSDGVEDQAGCSRSTVAEIGFEEPSFDERHPVGTLTGSDGTFFAIVTKDGEVRVPLDIDGARYWVITARGAHPGAEIAEVVRRVRRARASAPGLKDLSTLVQQIASYAARAENGTHASGRDPEAPPAAPTPLFMKVSAYAKYRGLCKRTIETRILEGMPLDGRGKYRRVCVERADEWFRNRGTAGLDDEAKLNAGRLARAQVRPNKVKP